MLYMGDVRQVIGGEIHRRKYIAVFKRGQQELIITQKAADSPLLSFCLIDS